MGNCFQDFQQKFGHISFPKKNFPVSSSFSSLFLTSYLCGKIEETCSFIPETIFYSFLIINLLCCQANSVGADGDGDGGSNNVA